MNETAEGSSIAVISTRMPYIDRRSLSEAWFSALHLASDGPAVRKSSERRDLQAVTSGARERVALKTTGPEPAAQPHGRSLVARPNRSDAGALERSATISAAHRRRAHSAFACARSYAPFRTSLTLGIDGERVALLLRREGATLHVVALCRPGVADLVRRALACADLHLRARGEAVRSRVETLPSAVIA